MRRGLAWSLVLALIPLLAGCLVQTLPEVAAPTPTATPPPLPPVGGRIAFLSDRTGTRELRVINPDGSRETALWPGQAMYGAAWAPDGRRLAFVADQGGKAQIGVLVVNPDNSPGARTLLTGDAPSSDNTRPAWAPDGRTLAFQSNRSGSFQVYTQPAAGGPVASFIHQPAWAGAPAWAPDARTLAFAGGPDAAHTTLYTVPAAGGSPLQINAINAGQTAATPSWAPDGSLILFLLQNSQGTHDLATIRPDGTGQHTLSSGPVVTHLVENTSPAWSPDGKWIAYNSDHDGENDIYVVDREGTQPVNLTNSPQGDTGPTWAPDTSRVAFSSNQDGAYRLWVVGRDGAHLSQLTKGSGDYGDILPLWSAAP